MAVGEKINLWLRSLREELNQVITEKQNRKVQLRAGKKLSCSFANGEEQSIANISKTGFDHALCICARIHCTDPDLHTLLPNTTDLFQTLVTSQNTTDDYSFDTPIF